MAVARPIERPPRRLTEEEFLRLPDDGRKYELVDGEAKEVPGGVRNDEIGAIVIYRLTPFIIGRGILCSSQAGFRMKNGNIRSPDVSFTRKERLPDGKAPAGFGDFAPDLCIEVISESEEPAEIRRKLREYFESGALRVWHLFPETQSVMVFTAPERGTTYQPSDELDGGELLPGFHAPVSELFSLE